MGYIRKRGENSWSITINAGTDPVTGKRKRIYKSIKGTKTEAKKVMQEIEYKLKNGSYIEPSDLTLRELMHRWYKDYAETNLAPSTQEYYQIIINSHITPLLGNVKISDLEPMHIQSYISEKLKNGRLDGKKGGLSNKSVKRHFSVLNQILKYAVKLQVLEKNPAKYVDPPKPERPEIQAMTQKDLKRILDIAEGWINDFIYIAAFTGVRRGELLALRWQDVSLKDESIQIRQSVSMLSGGKLIFREPKTIVSIRILTIDDDIAQILKRKSKEQKENKLRLGEEFNNEHNLVFCKDNGRPYLPLYTTRQFNKVAEKADLSQFRLHDLRHTHATLLLKAGVHPKIVQERLGHSSITQTLDTYSHITPNMQKEAMKKLKNDLNK